MGYRWNDWLCLKCDKPNEHLVWVDGPGIPPLRTVLECKSCFAECEHTRIPSAPAKYVYDRPYAPMVFGGKHDTMGYRSMPKLVDIPQGKQFDKARDIIGSPGMQDRAKERLAIYRENGMKRRRAEAMKKGETDIRRSPLPGDPSLEKSRGRVVKKYG